MFTTLRSLRTSRWLTGMAACLGLAAALAAPAPARAADPLARELLNQAPDILTYLRDHHYHNVGVLKFRVQKEGQLTDNAGPLNLNIAARLETALLLKYDMDADHDLTLLHDASATAATIQGANHLTPDGRARLFRAEYRALWGPQKMVRADAFLAGRIDFSDDLRTLTVAVCAFGRDSQVHKVVVFHAGTGPSTLVEAGESFNLRSILTKKGTFEEVALASEAADTAKKNDEGKAELSPLDDAPVLLEIHYVDQATGTDQVMKPRAEGGQLRIPGPEEGQAVYFKLKRNDASKTRYGVVLMLNGLNSVYKQRLPPEQCKKWIIGPDAPPYRIDGFQVNDQKVETFVVRSAEESAASEVKYGADAGIISYSVYREAPEKRPDPAAAPVAEKAREAAREEAAVTKPLPDPPADLPQDAGPVKEKALPDDQGSLGGHLLEGGGVEHDSGVQHVPFGNPVLVSSATIRYYQPQR